MRLRKRLLAVLSIAALAAGLGACVPGGASRVPGQEAGGTKAPLKLNFFLPTNGNAVLNDGDFVKKTIEERFNVRLQVTAVPSIQAKEKLNLLIASGSTPDLFVIDGRSSLDYHAMGIIGDLSGLMTPEKMPNYYRWTTQKEVGGFQFPGAYNRGPVLIERKVQASYYIRKDWLEALGLSVPTGYEELTAVARAFTHDDPDGNGADDTYGFGITGGGSFPQTFPLAFPQFMKNGILGMAYVDDEGYYHDGTSDPLMGRVVDDIVSWVDEGLLNPDWFMAGGSELGEAFARGKIGMIWLNGTDRWVLDADPNSFYSQLKRNVPDAEVVPFNPYPNKPLITPQSATVPWLIGKRTIERYPEKAETIVRIVDWLASEEGYLLTTYGQEGVHYTREGSVITIVPEAYEKEIAQKGNFLTVWKFLTPRESSRLGLQEIDPRLTERDRDILRTISSYPLAQGNGTLVLPPEGISIADFRARLGQYLQKMLFEDRGGAAWETYREELMTTHKGRLIFREYIRQMQAAGIAVKNDFD
jgi:putative aldouronate transport system substrate-binding protein